MTVPINPGDVIDDRYVVERLLGEGGMGAVFIAREDRLGRKVAIKVLLSAVAENKEAVIRFEREARSAAALQSDHVTRVLSVGHLAGGAPYIVMELLDGEDLSTTLTRRGALSAQEVIDFMTQVCDALAEAHALGIVHRDLKPANVFLSRRPGGGTRVKVLDFGISKGATGSVSTSLTSTTAIMGTPLYMSPEQLREARNVDGRADIWALGAMMYELLSGRTPFVSESLTELCVLIMTTHHEPLSTLRPGVSPALEAIVHRCLQKDPAGRFATVQDLVAAFAGVGTADEQPVTAPAPPPRMATPRMNASPLAGLPTEAVEARARAQAPTEASVKPIGESSPQQAAAGPAPPHAMSPHAMAQQPMLSYAIPPQATPANFPSGSSRFEPPAVAAATVDPVSNTQLGGLSPTKRPSVVGLAIVFALALAIGGGTLYALVLKPNGASQADQPGPTASETPLGLVQADPSSAAAPPPASATPPPPSAAPVASAKATPVVAAPTPVVLPPPVARPTPLALPPPASQPAVVPPPALPPPVVPPVAVKPTPSAKPAASQKSGPDSLMPGSRGNF
jgi:eukaryotic-like serine/threonine-protein kinase